jgi:hypothetical protein
VVDFLLSISDFCLNFQITRIHQPAQNINQL